MGAALLVVLLVVGLGFVSRLAAEATRAERLSVENDSLRRQFERLGQLESELTRMIQFGDQIRVLAGVTKEDVGLEGTGAEVPPETPAEQDATPGGDALSTGEIDGKTKGRSQ